jgi:hypothetical protein
VASRIFNRFGMNPIASGNDSEGAGERLRRSRGGRQHRLAVEGIVEELDEVVASSAR